MRRTPALLGSFARDSLVACLVSALALGPAALPALAGPRGENVRRGDVTIDHTPGSTNWTIHASDGSIIQYDSFDIALGEAVEFIQTRDGSLSADARVLNRILGDAPTRIEGSLTGNGHIYIVNPAGVFFASGATVNANAIHAAGGQISDADFASGVERYTGVVGDVQNATDIVASAVSLVGAEVVNSGRIIAEDGWIVLAAGNDVLIGRDDGGRGYLIRVVGASGAVFDPAATGVTNTGTLDAGAEGTVRVGAGDLYGTAIFSNSAIRAREIALAAGNDGDVALAGEVASEKLEVSFRGATPGQLRSAAAAGATTTVRTDDLKLATSGSGAQISVGSGLAFRSRDDAALGTGKVTLEQNAVVSSSQLAALDLGTATARELALRSTSGGVVVDDKTVVAGSQLALTGSFAEIQGTDALQVASLHVTGNAFSEADLVASSGDIAVTGNLLLVTKPETAGGPAPETLLSAHAGALDVDGSIITSDGGALRIEARNVDVGTIGSSGQKLGGVITTRGDVRIGFSEAGVEQTETVRVHSIDTRGAGDEQGGDVAVTASGDVAIGAISSNGGAATSANQPRRDGGSVRVHTADTARLEIGSVVTGGATASENGNIDLAAGTVLLSGNLDASAASTQNASGQRNRAVRVQGNMLFDADALRVAGGDVDLDGAIAGAEIIPETGPATTRRVDLTIAASGDTRLGGSADLRSLAIASTGDSVVLGGDVDADASVKIAFDGSGTGAISNDGSAVAITTNLVELAASDSAQTNGTSARIALGEGIDFNLVPITGTTPLQATLSLAQDASIDSATASRLADAGSATPNLRVELRSNDAVALDSGARADLAGSDLLISSNSFSALGATGSASDFELSSLELATRGALEVDFGVTAESVRLNGGAAGTGGLTLGSELAADTIALVAGDGTGGVGNASSLAFGPGASLRSRGDASAQPLRVDLIQDASIDSASLPDTDIFGAGGVAGLDYRLASLDGSVTLSAGTSDKFSGSALDVRGQTGVNLGSEALTLASLSAETAASLVVSTSIQALAPDGKIRLRSGSDGTGDLTVDGRLSADRIELVAGSGNGNDSAARIVLEDDARFSAALGDAAPLRFTFEQDAAIGNTASGSSATAVPGLAVFGGSVAGMEYALRSKGASLRLDDTSLVAGSRLELAGDTALDINGDLDVASLELESVATLSGNVASTGDVSILGQLSLDGTGAQSLSAGAGALTSPGAITKTGAGALSIDGRAVTVSSVTTGRTGDSLSISATEGLTTGALNTSGLANMDGGDIAIDGGTGSVAIGSITTRGANGPVSTTAPGDGRDAGSVSVSGGSIAIGSVDTRGGDASAIATGAAGAPVVSRQGGDAGQITLSAAEVTLNAGLDARGGAGASSDPSLVSGLSGAAADVTVNGALRLGANATSGAGNAIRGDRVTVSGDVRRADTRAAGETALFVGAQNGIAFGGDLSGGRIDLELANGNLDLASGGVTGISADTIRLAATDGNGGATTGEVIFSGLSLSNEAGTSAPRSFTLEQDRSIGGADGSAVPAGALFEGGSISGPEHSIALISHDGGVTLSATDVAEFAGANLTLAANGVAGSAGPAVVVNDSGLALATLQIGSIGANGERVAGDARIGGDLALGEGGLLSYAGLVDVDGAAAIGGPTRFAGAGDQVLRVADGRTLSLGGVVTSKSTSGKLTLDADRIELVAAGAQVVESQFGQLVFGSDEADGIVRGSFDAAGAPVSGSSRADLTLRGSAAEGDGPAISVNGTRSLGDGRNYAIAVANGDLLVDARAIATDSTSTPPPATWAVEGDVLAHGDVDLRGRGSLEGGLDDYAISARRGLQSTGILRGGELRIAGISSVDGDLALYADGDVPTEVQAEPSALFLSGDFELAHDLSLFGVTEVRGDTQIDAAGDVLLASLVRGNRNVSIESEGAIEVRDDVALAGSAFAASAANGIAFTSADPTQTLQAGSLSFGSGDTAAAGAPIHLQRNGDLTLVATAGNVDFGEGQRLIVAGDLDVSATGSAILADTAALDIDVSAPRIQIRGNSVVVANDIRLSSRPSTRGGTGTLAAPTRERIRGDVAARNVMLRQIANETVELSQADLAAGIFPTVSGPAYFDYATEVPHIGRPASIARPRADARSAALARAVRPLWADELLVYLDARSRRAPSELEQGALPPVSAGPNEASPDTEREQASPAVEQALVPYRALFRPSPEVDPETGIVEGEDRTPQIRESFERAASVAAARSGNAPPSASEVLSAIDSDPELADAASYRADLAALLAQADRALDAEQRARFRSLLLARVAPSGMAPAQFEALIP